VTEKTKKDEAEVQDLDSATDPLAIVEQPVDVPDHERRRQWKEKLHAEVEDSDLFVLNPSVAPADIVARDVMRGLQVQYKTLAHTVVDHVATEEGVGHDVVQGLADNLRTAVEAIAVNQREGMFNG
jgi:hypothetical protein